MAGGAETGGSCQIVTAARVVVDPSFPGSLRCTATPKLNMSKQTWICVPCRKVYMRKKYLTSVECPKCQGPCELVHTWGIPPSPKHTKAWDEFIARNRADAARLEASRQAERERQEQMQDLIRPKKPSPPEEHVPYLAAIRLPAIKTLTHSAGLPANQLAGHAANLEFWVGEAKHCLAAIDGYWERFKRLRTRQVEYEKQHNMPVTVVSLRRGIGDADRQELRRVLLEAIEQFLSRCRREGLISTEELKAALAELGR